VVEASRLDPHERLIRLKGSYFFNLNRNDLGATGAKGAGNPPMRNRAHSDTISPKACGAQDVVANENAIGGVSVRIAGIIT
jgi:hypothetical protein